MRMQITWDETESVSTRYYEDIDVPDDIAGIEDPRERNEAILEYVREVTDWTSNKFLYSEVTDAELIDIQAEK